MKMVYETPKMRVEQFRANQYVAACEETFTGFVRAWDHIIKDWRYFFGDVSVKMVNPNDGSPQWYYKEIDANYNEETQTMVSWTYATHSAEDPLYYLEHSVHQDGASVLYKEAGAASGYSTDRDSDIEISGLNSLQVNNGGPSNGHDGRHDFQNPAGYISGTDWRGNPTTPYYNYDVTTGNPHVDANGNYDLKYAYGRYADECLGRVEKFETLTDYRIISS